jgi:hypothetical protein
MFHKGKSSFVVMVLLCAGFAFAQTPRIELSTSPYVWKMTGSATNAIQGGTADAGATVSGAGYAPSAVWLTATVPGTVFSTFVDNNKYTNPYIDRNIATQLFEQGVDLCNDAVAKGYGWWFRTNFTVTETDVNRRIWLHFKGINYRAQVWVNGTHINDQDGNATSRGAFKHFYFDITSVAVRSTANANAVAVLILPNTAGGNWHQVTAADHGGNGGVLSQDGPTFIPTGGWDWIPTIPDRSAGIYDQVMLESRGPVTIKYPYVNPLLSADYSRADITITAQLENATAAAVNGTLFATINGATVSAAVALTANQKKIVPVYYTLNAPRLWWPNGYGAQDMYSCQFRFEVGAGAVSDSLTVPFGCRKISYAIEANVLATYINGKRIFWKGGNWGMDEAMKRWDPAHLEMQMRYHKELHFTGIRNWVGQTDRELFYNLCDKYGVMIWDDFWIPHPNDGPDPTDKVHFMNHAVEKIKRCRNHPCMGLYCGKNEGDRNGLLNTELSTAIDTGHHGMDYVRWSTDGASGVRGFGPYGWRLPDAVFTNNNVSGITSEFGMPNVWVDRTGRRTISEANLSPVCNATGTVTNGFWGWHDFCGGSAMQGTAFCTDLVNRFGWVLAPGNALVANKDFCMWAQCQNYDGYRAMFEAYNSHMNDGTNASTSGCLIWMSNPSWPSNVWQTYDYYGDCNGGGYGAGKACEPIHIQTTFNASYYLDVINNTLQPLTNCIASCEVWDTTGVRRGTQATAAMTFPANAKTYTNITVNMTPSTSNLLFMKCVLRDAGNNVLSSNVYARAKANDWNQLRALRTMRKLTVGTELTATAATHTVSGTTHTISTTITNTTTNKIAHMVRLTLLKRGVTETGSGASYVDPRVLPTYYNDNYFTLMPGDALPVTMEYDTKDGGTTPNNVDLEIKGVTLIEGIVPMPNGTVPVLPGMTDYQTSKYAIDYVPSKGIMINAGKNARLTVSLFDMLGKMVTNRQVEGTGKVYLGAKNIPGGLYVVKITDVATAKSIIQRVMVR